MGFLGTSGAIVWPILSRKENKMSFGYVYALQDPRNETVRYVGITRRTLAVRFAEHLQDIKKRSNYVQRWIRYLVCLNLQPKLVCLESCNSESELYAAEQKWIAYYRGLVGKLLTNVTGGGPGHFRPVIELAKKKHKQMCGENNPMFGRKHSAETKAKISARATGRKCSPDTIAKRVASQTGLKRSDVFRKNLSITRRGSGSPSSKLNDIDVLEIRLLFKQGVSISKIEKRYPVGYMGVYKIVKYLRWTHLP